MRLKLICAVLVGVLLIAATGCGSKKKSESTTTKATTTQEATTTEASTTSSSGGVNLTSEDCQKLAAASETVSQAFTGSVPGDMAEQVARLNALAKAAPKEIQADFATLAKAAGEVAKLGLKPGATPTAEQLAAISALDVAGISKAATNIGAWAQKNCAAGG
jgi:hypothetical protein